MSVKKSGLYTRTGDKGTSSLFNGQRVAKDDPIFDAIGTVDELNSFVGVAYAVTTTWDGQVPKQLNDIQNRLFDIGSSLSTPTDTSSETKIAKTAFDPQHLQNIERYIDELDAQVPKLRNFILPTGPPLAAHLHVCRSVARRAERCVLFYSSTNSGLVDSNILKYLNRLSDYFFAAARYVTPADQEVIWKHS